MLHHVTLIPDSYFSHREVHIKVSFQVPFHQDPWRKVFRNQPTRRSLEYNSRSSDLSILTETRITNPQSVKITWSSFQDGIPYRASTLRRHGHTLQYLYRAHQTDPLYPYLYPKLSWAEQLAFESAGPKEVFLHHPWVKYHKAVEIETG